MSIKFTGIFKGIKKNPAIRSNDHSIMKNTGFPNIRIRQEMGFDRDQDGILRRLPAEEDNWKFDTRRTYHPKYRTRLDVNVITL